MADNTTNMKEKRIKYSNLPMRMPLTHTVLALIACDYFNVSPLGQGIIYTLLGVLWLSFIISLFQHEHVDIFEYSKHEALDNRRSRFHEKLTDALNKAKAQSNGKH
jgi:hypothetical protein